MNLPQFAGELTDAPDPLQTVVGGSCRNCGNSDYHFASLNWDRYKLPAVLYASEVRMFDMCTECGGDSPGIALAPASPDAVHSQPLTYAEYAHALIDLGIRPSEWRAPPPTE